MKILTKNNIYLLVRFYYPVPDNVISKYKKFQCTSKSHFGIVFKIQTEFIETDVVTSKRKVELIIYLFNI